MNTKLPIEKIRYIFFDIYGTLAGFYPEREKIQRKILSDNKIYLSNDQISFGYKFADEYMADQKKLNHYVISLKIKRKIFFQIMS